MRIIVIASLAEFTAEIPPPGPARLSVASDAGLSALDLQGLTPDGLIWLHDHYSDGAPASVHSQIPEARELIAAWLIRRGYEVRAGRWLTPRFYKPDRGTFEAIAWQQHGPGCYKLVEL